MADCRAAHMACAVLDEARPRLVPNVRNRSLGLASFCPMRANPLLVRDLRDLGLVLFVDLRRPLAQRASTEKQPSDAPHIDRHQDVDRVRGSHRQPPISWKHFRVEGNPSAE